MAKTKISEYSATPGNNTDINNIDIAEGCSPSGINNAIRELMSDLKDWQAGNVSGQAMAVVSGGTGAETAADARTNLSAAKSGANTDITSLGGLTTPISVAQGGTGYTSTRDITYVTVASNVVTIETSVAHGFVVNDIVAVTAVTNTNVNGTGFTIVSVPSTTTFTYAKTATNYARTADTGSVVSSSYLTVANMSGIVPVIHGGTGAATLKANNLLVGNGTSSPTVIPAGTTGNVLTSTQASSVNAGSFVVGTEYTISSVGTTTNWTSIGASSGTVGVVFTATGTGSGDGVATTNTWTSSALNKLTAATAKTYSDATNSGTTIDFTSIPSWVKRITLAVNSVSVSGTSDILVQLGTGGTATTTGYVSSASSSTTTAAVTSTSGFLIYSNDNTDSTSGIMTIVKITGNSWIASGVFQENGAGTLPTAGQISLSGTLDILRIATQSAQTFTAGTFNIMYE